MSNTEKSKDVEQMVARHRGDARPLSQSVGVVRIAGRDYLSAARLAEILGVTTRTLHRWDAHRVGPPKIKAGRLVLYDAEKIPAWLESRETRPVRLTARRDARNAEPQTSVRSTDETRETKKER